MNNERLNFILLVFFFCVLPYINAIYFFICRDEADNVFSFSLIYLLNNAEVKDETDFDGLYCQHCAITQFPLPILLLLLIIRPTFETHSPLFFFINLPISVWINTEPNQIFG